MPLHSYPSIYNLGHKNALDLFADPVVVQEKIDGSQFSFGVAEDGVTLALRSKGAEIFPDNPPKMFVEAVETVTRLAPDLIPGATYRGEFLQRPKHNTLAYERVPLQHIILFDVDRGDQDYLTTDELRTEAGRLGLECVPIIYEGRVNGLEHIQSLMQSTSILGGTTPEGLVFKNYHRFGPDKKVLMGKYVTEAFKEVHAGEWKKANPGHGDIIASIISTYRSPGRWRKAIQHLRDAGTLTDSPQDIGNLMKEASQDVLKECEGEIRDALFKWAWPKISRGVVSGLPQWYKDELAKAAFANEAAAEERRQAEDLRCEAL